MSYNNVYNLDALMNKSRCRIVFADNYDTAMDIKAFFAEQNPKYISEINENFLHDRKVGPFKIKNKTSILQHLLKTAAAKELLDNNADAQAFIKAELKKMELDLRADSSPIALSTLQRLRASYLYDVLDGKFDFLLCDCEVVQSEDKQKRLNIKQAYFDIAEYMRCSEQYEFAMYELVWITDLSVDEMLGLLGDSAKEEDYSFFAVDDADITELDKQKLLSDFAKTKVQPKEEKRPEMKEIATPAFRKACDAAKAERAYADAKQYDRYFRTVSPQYRGKDDLKKAFELYKTAAEMGHPGARFNLGNLYGYGPPACEEDKEKALYWYIMAEHGEDNIDGVSDSVIGEVHYLAPIKIKRLVLDVPSGKEMLRKYAGDKAEALIKEAENEKIVEELSEIIGNSIDQDLFNKEMDRALEGIRKVD